MGAPPYAASRLRVAGHLRRIRRRVSPEAAKQRRETASTIGRTHHPLWYVYFLQLNNSHIYVGSTDDLKRRFKSHQQGQVLSTRSKLPVTLGAYVAVADEKMARRLERYFKSGSGKAFAKKRFLATEKP